MVLMKEMRTLTGQEDWKKKKKVDLCYCMNKCFWVFCFKCDHRVIYQSRTVTHTSLSARWGSSYMLEKGWRQGKSPPTVAWKGKMFLNWIQMRYCELFFFFFFVQDSTSHIFNPQEKTANSMGFTLSTSDNRTRFQLRHLRNILLSCH